ncbi:MAG TPA: ABC transporter ATP-binding protein [Spirochaetota bacterium]|mgnify:CR=1 FL=1|nr:ABC transporter ATP-binding protein [Spirochaetota bacterium]HOD13085.1 ABC transporter ATP-binding protein [Spirochaetota bacterium]HPG49657.1 ABC transporter ATP-binding protein [Spirochaetota bacterium]HPN13220.1 ABC transporter ATP-binding protein [Spirochaetota bacterium]
MKIHDTAGNAGRVSEGGEVLADQMIQIQRLHKAYDDVIALRDIDLIIRKGAITGLLGPNGAGKTTLVSILTGILKKTSGHVIINGMDLDREADGIKSITGMVPQTLALYPLLSPHENLEYFGALYGLSGKRLKERMEFAIEVASLRSFLHRRAGKCSGGMQRRLNLAIGLLNEPKILYLDEPTVGVDAQSRQYMLDMIRKINLERGTTIIYTSHYISEIEQISDDIVIIDEGSIILNNTKETILSSGDACAIQIDPADASIGKALRGIPGVTVESGTIYIDRNEELYSNIIQALSLLRENRIGIMNMRYNTNRLEELYLHLTSRQLRDNE